MERRSLALRVVSAATLVIAVLVCTLGWRRPFRFSAESSEGVATVSAQATMISAVAGRQADPVASPRWTRTAGRSAPDISPIATGLARDGEVAAIYQEYRRYATDQPLTAGATAVSSMATLRARESGPNADATWAPIQTEAAALLSGSPVCSAPQILRDQAASIAMDTSIIKQLSQASVVSARFLTRTEIRHIGYREHVPGRSSCWWLIELAGVWTPAVPFHADPKTDASFLPFDAVVRIAVHPVSGDVGPRSVQHAGSGTGLFPANRRRRPDESLPGV